MKKYLPGTLAILLALLSSAFITKKEKTTANYVFRFPPYLPASTSNLLATSNIDIFGQTVTYYTNWELVESAFCPSLDERACTIAVSEPHIIEISSSPYTYKLLKLDPDGTGPKKEYIMSVVDGYLQLLPTIFFFKKVNVCDEIPGEIEITNRRH